MFYRHNVRFLNLQVYLVKNCVFIVRLNFAKVSFCGSYSRSKEIVRAVIKSVKENDSLFDFS